VDVSVSARTSAGLVVAGGVSSGKRTTDNCDVVAKVPEALLGAQLLGPHPASWLPAQSCAVWQRPQSILQARFAKISAQFDF
jgi:hypothetical protein